MLERSGLDQLRGQAEPVPGELGDALERLDTTPAVPAAGAYAREEFGQRWADVDRNGCDQRNDALRAQLTEVQLKPGTRGCKVLAGTLTGPYSGRVLAFTSADPKAVQIDHVVSLSDAWSSGAWQWSQDRREAFANDPQNLLAVDGPTNQAKGDKNAAQWVPGTAAGRCLMAKTQIQVKTDWQLSVTERERAALRKVLAGCE
ncbi:HNH endonuclease family protein [Micrococcus luteus]|uniref:HNH endonuclease family protein n=1 Tax=Micrococcus luteus TaxID=1270 RepID=UPI003407A29E